MVLNDITTKNVLGCVLRTRNNGNLKVVSVNGYDDVTVEFLETGFKTKVEIGNLRRGTVKDKLRANVFNYGVVGDKYPIKIDGVITKEYSCWHSMIERCRSEKLHKGINKTYKDCTTSENFRYYTHFYEWCNKQIGFKDGFELDKDLLVKGNKIYSEDNCVFLPQQINKVLTKSTATRGSSLIGTTFNKRLGKYVSQMNKDNNKVHLGVYDTELEAFNAYKQAKESYLKELANKWKDKIDERAYQALMNYQVEITD